MDDRVPERRDSHASSFHEPSLEPTPTRSAKTLDRVTSTCRSTASVVEDAKVDSVRDGTIWAGAWHLPTLLWVPAGRACWRICMVTLRRYFFVGRASDFVNVHDDTLWEALGMTAPSSEQITNACDVKVTDEDGFLSRCVGHERANLNQSCRQQDRVLTLHPNTDAR